MMELPKNYVTLPSNNLGRMTTTRFFTDFQTTNKTTKTKSKEDGKNVEMVW